IDIGPADHGGFQNIGMALQHALHLERRDVHARDLEHVVAPAAVDEVAVLVDDVFVAGARPFADEGGARLLAIVPVHNRAGRSALLQLAHLARLIDRPAVVVDKTDVVARHRVAARSIFDLTGPIAEKDVQHFGRAETVENVDAVTFAPAPADL